jgi:ABC-2 type transport system ATP-binding protein
VIALGTPLELIASLGAEHVVEFALAEGTAMPGAEALAALPGVRRASLAEGRGTLIVARLHEALPALLALVADPEAFTLLTTHSATLEDVFVSLTGRHLRDA